MRRGWTSLVIAASAALAVASPTADDIRTDAETRGVVQVGTPTAAPLGGLETDGRTYGGGHALVLELAEPLPPQEPWFVDRAYVSESLGTYWVRRDDRRLSIPFSRWYGPTALYGVAGEHGLSRRILQDLDARGVVFEGIDSIPAEDGPNGERPLFPESGGVRVALVADPPGSADFETLDAYIDPDASLYWVLRSGGFVGFSQWAGPFPVPRAQDDVPSEVRPPSIRVRNRARKRTLTIRRALTGEGSARVRRRDYAPSDFYLGDGVEVLRVLRANATKIRLRVRIAAGARTGTRDVTVNGKTGEELLKLR